MRGRFGVLMLLTLVAAQGAGAQSASQLVEETADYYATLNGYEFDGVLNSQLPGTGWELNAPVSLNFPLKGSFPASSPYNFEADRFHRGTPVRTGRVRDQSLPEFVYPVIGRFDEIEKAMLGAEEIGRETLRLNQAPVACEIVKVRYSSTEEHPHAEVVTYWINPASHLVLRERFITHHPGPRVDRAVFTLTITTAKFGVPTPQWILDMAVEQASRSDVTEKTDWIGKAAPDFALPSLMGAQVRLSSLRGKVVLLDFWAIGCAPCRRELPVVEDLSHHYGGDRLDVLKISSLDDATAMRAWLAKNNYSLDALVDSDWTAANRFKVQGIPSLILIGRDGKIQGYWEGPASQAMLQAAVDRALAR
jgi:cytochrome c biogenesis protein CcmG, thiol:disulfide interchange protein DsbE